MSMSQMYAVPLSPWAMNERQLKRLHRGVAEAYCSTVFDSKTTQYYADCLVEAIEKGAVEIDDQQRRDIVFCPSTGAAWVPSSSGAD